MANKDFNSIADAIKYLQRNIQSTLKNEIAQVAQDTMERHVHSDVYDVYDPVDPSKRRMYNDGLIDSRNMEIEVLSDDTISLENIAYDGDRNVPLIVESGVGYYDGAPSVLTKGRKFTENTYLELKSTDILKNTMIRGLSKRGIKAEK